MARDPFPDDVVRRWCAHFGVSQAALAAAANIEPYNVYRAGRTRKDVNTLSAIANGMEALRPGFGATLDQLACRTPWEPPVKESCACAPDTSCTDCLNAS